jgi:hypothetical protein
VQPDVLSQVTVQGRGESSSSAPYVWENSAAMNTELPTSPGASSSSTLTAVKEGDSKLAPVDLSIPYVLSCSLLPWPVSSYRKKI